jgi:hypothetical protein
MIETASPYNSSWVELVGAAFWDPPAIGAARDLAWPMCVPFPGARRRNGRFTSIGDVRSLATNVRSESNTIKLIGFWP